MRLFIIAVLVVASITGASVYFAKNGGGEINVNERISTTNQQDFIKPVQQDTRAVVPNGGLRPQTGDVPRPPEPAPVAPVEASTTEASATSTAPIAEEGTVQETPTPENTPPAQ